MTKVVISLFAVLASAFLVLGSPVRECWPANVTSATLCPSPHELDQSTTKLTQMGKSGHQACRVDALNDTRYADALYNAVTNSGEQPMPSACSWLQS